MLFHAALRLAARVEVCGLELANLSEIKSASQLFHRVREAVGLLERTTPHLAARMRSSIKRIIIVPSGGAEGAYWSFLNACVLSADHVLKDSATSIAMTLAHEATHARLRRAGIIYHPELRARIEAICVQAEIELAQMLPNAHELLEEARKALDTRWWEGDASSNRELAQLQSLGVPAWLRRLRQFMKSKIRSR
jgi:hypothetical protein